MRALYAFVIVLVSFSCMVYELTLAQTSSLLLGNALVNYSVTICIYLAGLGVGSLLFMRYNSESAGPLLLNTEIVLSYLGPLAPILALLVEFSLRQVVMPGSLAYFFVLQSTMYVLVALVGILSGLELPIMISLGETRFRMQSGAVLGLDYLGTLVAIAAFPTVGLGMLGLFGTAALAGVGSWGGAVMTWLALPPAQRHRWQLVLLAPSLALVMAMLAFGPELREFMSQSIYLAGDK
ncbi:MAG: hypothetical protein KF799_04845 [Bdellovibrionales bacterium]|nr:hypothetical protein [Bdellovibrionales bacterium]